VKINKKMKDKGQKLFGTDGIRGLVGQFPFDDPSILKLGTTIGQYLHAAPKPCRIVIGRDTRSSGSSIERLLTTGILQQAAQTEIYSCSVIPTPGLSFVTRNGDFDYGIMITASHNPYTDNGIKIFNSRGEKISNTMEQELEHIFFNPCEAEQIPVQAIEPAIITDPAKTNQLYYQFLATHAQGIPGARFKVVLDCAHGATFQLAPRVFREVFPHLTVTHAAPDGRNINLHCGSTHTASLAQTVQALNADIGIAFDGDGDRVLFVDSHGHLLDGDFILYILAAYFLKTSQDFNNTKLVVGTVMANLGLEKALAQLGILFLRTEVGDKYVSSELKLRGAILGGEQSGHIVLPSFQPTGDGLLTALYFLKALATLDIHPSQVIEQFKVYPQVIKNIPITHKKDLQQWEQLQQMSTAFNEKYRDHSRLLIRYSGTEPIIRLMMESQHPHIIEENMTRFEQVIRSAIGK